MTFETLVNNNFNLDSQQQAISKQLDKESRVEFGQYMTPNSIATFMASLFKIRKNITLLDPGAGIGSLTSAFLKKFKNKDNNITSVVWEIDPKLIKHLHQTLHYWKDIIGEKFEYIVNSSDFIEDTCLSILYGKNQEYSHIIINPPYKKINNNSKHRYLLSKVGIETVNLYAAFIALSVKLLKQNGELVAIIPRSFCNGTYFKPFRELLLNYCAINRIHLFESRSRTFKDENILQENIIIHLKKNAQQDNVIISISSDSEFSDIKINKYDFSAIVKPDDEYKFIHIPSSAAVIQMPLICTNTLSDLGLEVSTGPVVDFRMKEFLSVKINKKSIPLLYTYNFSENKLIWPKEHKKPNALIPTKEINKWLLPNGNYVLVKRFSSKEEKKRVVAYYLDANDLDTPVIGIENHFNYFHKNKKGVDKNLALGLSIYLNSTILDNYFRVFSGHTQVNANDLRNILYPDIMTLTEIGKISQNKIIDQNYIDNLIKEL